MKISGWQKTTLLDFPGCLATIIFTPGCNLRCPFCFNKDLVLDRLPLISEEKIFSFLEKRKSLLDGVVVTGGEPTLQKDLDIFLQKIKRLGYKIKLDTNGSNPKTIASLLDCSVVDYIAMDYKGPIREYGKITKVQDSGSKAQKTIKILVNSVTPFELRTTIVPGIHDEAGLRKMGKELSVFGVDRAFYFQGWFWQNFQAKTCLDPAFEKKTPYGKIEIEEFSRQTKNVFGKIIVR